MEGIDCYFSACENLADFHVCYSDFLWMSLLYLFLGALFGINVLLPIWKILKSFLVSVYHWFVFVCRGLRDQAELSHLLLAKEKASNEEKEAP